MFNYLKNKYTCFRQGHIYKFEQDSLIGEWIRCARCHKLDEYVPGAHEPKGYESKYR